MRGVKYWSTKKKLQGLFVRNHPPDGSEASEPQVYDFYEINLGWKGLRKSQVLKPAPQST